MGGRKEGRKKVKKGGMKERRNEVKEGGRQRGKGDGGKEGPSLHIAFLCGQFLSGLLFFVGSTFSTSPRS